MRILVRADRERGRGHWLLARHPLARAAGSRWHTGERFRQAKGEVGSFL